MADRRAGCDLLVFVSDRAHRQQRSRLRVMTAATDTAAATSSRFGTFALVFGICFAILYVVCDMASLPMFTYHPGPDRIDPRFTPARLPPRPARRHAAGKNPRQNSAGTGVDRTRSAAAGADLFIEVLLAVVTAGRVQGTGQFRFMPEV